MVGNSSSGLLEVPSFSRGTINIGDRQRGRLKAESVIDCMPEHESIAMAIQRLYSNEFQQILKTVQSPYGEGGASDRVVETLKTVLLGDVLKKRFFDLNSL